MFVSIVAFLDIQQHLTLSALSVREVVGVKSAAQTVAWHRFAFLTLANFFFKNSNA